MSKLPRSTTPYGSDGSGSRGRRQLRRTRRISREGLTGLARSFPEPDPRPGVVDRRFADQVGDHPAEAVGSGGTASERRRRERFLQGLSAHEDRVRRCLVPSEQVFERRIHPARAEKPVRPVILVLDPSLRGPVVADRALPDGRAGIRPHSGGGHAQRVEDLRVQEIGVRPAGDPLDDEREPSCTRPWGACAGVRRRPVTVSFPRSWSKPIFGKRELWLFSPPTPV